MNLDSNWFTEVCVDEGIAMSYQTSEKVHSEKTPYQHIDIYKTKNFGYLMAIDGFIQLTSRDNFLYHEMLTHPALFSHQNPEHVVVIGGGDCGTLREVLKHDSVKTAHQIEIDERVTVLARKYFPELCAANDDERATLYFGDGIKWMAEKDPESLDIIIVDSTDPIGPAEGLFTESFYKNCLKALKPGGIIVQQSESPLIHREKIILPMHKAMRAAGFDQTKTIDFPQPCYPSGWWSATMAGKENSLTEIRLSDIASRPFKTTYFNESIAKATYSCPQFLSELIDSLEY